MEREEKESTLGHHLNVTPQILDSRSSLSQCLLLFPFIFKCFSFIVNEGGRGTDVMTLMWRSEDNFLNCSLLPHLSRF